jgi:DNA mismatch repair protein MutL
VDSVIRVLPQEVVDQIAAGEVIERPASVVKELVDNAIDAGARTVTVDVVGGGRGLVRVVDDGCGMSAADARLALLPHATSKLRAADELWGLPTMGFRGEALPSIASVSRLVMTTRRAGDLAATRVEVTAGAVEVSEVGAPAGTTVEVHELFGVVPARLKFLKGAATEASHVTELVARIAMAHPRLHVKLRHDGRTALELPPDRDGGARAAALLGPRVAARLVAATGEEDGVRVTAYLAAAEHALTTAKGVQLFVGRRPVRDRGLLHAVAMGYGELVPRGRYPVAVVMVDCAAGVVDVNVHPQKQEVRFADAGAVCAAVRHVVQAAVARAPWRAEVAGGAVQTTTAIASAAPPALPLDGAGATALAARYASQLRDARQLGFAGTARESMRREARGGFGATLGNAGAHARQLAFATTVREASGPAGGDELEAAAMRGDVGRDAFAETLRDEAAGSAGAQGAAGEPRDVSAAIAARAWVRDIKDRVRASRAAELVETKRGYSALAEVVGRASGEPAVGRGGDIDPGVAAMLDDVAARSDELTAVPDYFARLRYLGQLDLTFLVCEGDGELVLVDQHAAHERVELARRFARRGGTAEVAAQKLLFPVTFEATVAELARVTRDRDRDVLAQLGFEVELFGGKTIAIKAAPADDAARLLRALLARWERDRPSDGELLLHALSELACHAAVRAGDRLSASEVEALLASLDSAFGVGVPDPHGRPMLLRLPLADLARRFGR